MLRVLILATFLPAAAMAQVFQLESAPRLGVKVGPAYPGASEYEVGPDFGFTFGSLRLGDDITFGSGYERKLGFGIGPSFGFIGERDSSDYDEIAGLGDVDATLEAGVSLAYRGADYGVFGNVRRGFGGHEGFVVDLGANYIARPSREVTIVSGPRLTLADDEYVSTYFDVDAGESAASGLSQFDGDGGLVSAGVEVIAIYRLGGDWAVEGGVTYDRFLGDPADSSVVDSGSDEQFGVRLGISRRIRLGF